MDREEVEPLDEREAEDPECRQEEQLAAADAQALPAGDGKDRHEDEGGAGRAHFAQAQRRDPGAEDRLRNRPVDPPEARRGEHHRVAEQRPAGVGLRSGEDRLHHAAKLSDYTWGHLRGVAQPG